MKIVGATLGWDKRIHLVFDDGKILWGDADRILFPEYFRNNNDWPVDPVTGKKIEIYDEKVD